MSHFGDLIAGVKKVAPTPSPQPVVEKPVEVEKVSEFPQIYSKQDLMKMTKIELEEVGRTYGIELDRRLTHAKLVVQLKSFIDSKS